MCIYIYIQYTFKNLSDYDFQNIMLILNITTKTYQKWFVVFKYKFMKLWFSVYTDNNVFKI